MKVVIPLAGKGTRLRPHTHVTPKPLLRVGDKPVMAYIMDDLRELGVREAVFITGHLKDKVEKFVQEEYPDFTAHYVEQAIQDGTAGAVALAESFVDEDLLIIFVDTLFDADLSIVKQLPDDVAGVIWVKEVEDYQRFGVVLTDENGFMRQIVEKPSEPVSKLANIGLYYIRDWQLLFEGIRHVMEGTKGPGEEYYLTDAFQYMIDHGAKIRTVPVEGWYDCGAKGTLLETNEHLLRTSRGRRPDGGTSVKIHDPVRIAEGVELHDAEIGPNVTIGTGSVIHGAKLSNTIIGEKTRIENATLHDSLIGDRVLVRGVSGSLNVGDDSEVVGG